MKTCPHCGQRNREGLFFCEECGHNLSEETNFTVPTRQFGRQPGEMSARATWGTAHFKQDSTVILQVRDAPEPIILLPARRTVLGRADVNSPTQPDLDLNPYGALEKGVSRVHAVVERSDDTLTLIDMGSSNGTHLNGQRIGPNQPRVLRDGDEIRLGKLVAHIFFK